MIATVSRFTPRTLRAPIHISRANWLLSLVARPLGLPGYTGIFKQRSSLSSSLKLPYQPASRLYHASDNETFYHYVAKAEAGQFVHSEEVHSDGLVISSREKTRAAAWVQLLDKYLPNNLRTTQDTDILQVRVDSDASLKEIEAICSSSIIHRASQPTQIELFGWMIENGRKDAALYLMRQLLKSVGQRYSKPVSTPPSNIAWPQSSLDSFCEKPIHEQSFLAPPVKPVDLSYDTSIKEEMTKVDTSLLNHLYATLGQLVINSAEVPDFEGQELMNTVMLVFSEIHNLGLMPDDMYSHKMPTYSSFLYRPPIMHLLSSRILTSISDAAWRENQNEAISQARRLGVTDRQIAVDPPGGRFRLKVRPLGPEVWLELILWCCIENTTIDGALRIIQMLKARSENPWYALNWTRNGLTSSLGTRIDWDRAQTRVGGPVGLIEGYSREKPIVEMPKRTISREVILALLDLLLNSANLSSSTSATLKLPEVVQKNIVDVVLFLEPHDLPIEIFDYLSVRLDQSGAFDLDQHQNSLKLWSENLAFLRSLEKIPRVQESSVRHLSLDTILLQSELQTGILHQALDASIRAGDFHEASEVFNEIQKLVDQSKLNAIQNFLSEHTSLETGFFSSQAPSSQEFLKSHGQIPLYKLAGLLNLISDCNMLGLGKWLVYAEDIDGPPIPPSCYGTPNMTVALVRFASISRDVQLFKRVVDASSDSPLLPTVRVLRAIVNAHIRFFDYKGAKRRLVQLKTAQGGGFHPNNVAQLASEIIRLELHPGGPEHRGRDIPLTQARNMMHAVLAGAFDSRRSDFTRRQRTEFQQQTSHLLRIFESCGSSQLADIAKSHKSKLKPGHSFDLPASSFNTILSAILDTQGTDAGVIFWTKFCRDSIFPTSHVSRADDVGGTVPDTQQRKDLLNLDNVPWSEDTMTIMQGLETETMNDKHKNANQMQEDFAPEVDLASTSTSNGSNETGITIETGSSFPLITPNAQTLRLIVRSLVNDGQLATSEGVSLVYDHDDILRWVIERFKELGVHPKSVMRELQQPLTDDVAEMWELPNLSRGRKRRAKRSKQSKLHPAFKGRSHTGPIPQAVV